MNISGPSASLVETEQTPENTKRIPNTPEPAAEGDIQMEYASYYLGRTNIGAATKNYPKDLRSVYVKFTIEHVTMAWCGGGG